MTQAEKEMLFQQMLSLEHKRELYCDGKLYDNVDYWSMAEGAYKMLQAIGIGTEYINWAIGK